MHSHLLIYQLISLSAHFPIISLSHVLLYSQCCMSCCPARWLGNHVWPFVILYIVYLVFVFVGLFLSLIPGATPFSFPPANVFRDCHHYTRDLCDMEVCCSYHTVSPGDRGPSPVALNSLALALWIFSFILRGMAQGFHIGFDQSICCL